MSAYEITGDPRDQEPRWNEDYPRHPAETEADYEPDYDGFDSRGDR